MSIILELYNLRNNLKGEKTITRKEIDLNKKVDQFINWYYENMVKGKYTNIEQLRKPKEMRDFIDKMAIWYDFKYPSYEISRIIPESDKEQFIKNEKSKAKDLFNNIDTFIDTLSDEEKNLFKEEKYPEIVYIKKGRNAHIHLTKEGMVEESEGLEAYTNFKIKDKEIEKKHIKEVIKLLKENDIILEPDNEIEEAIKKVENYNYQKNEMLNSVMYRIIERGGYIMGPRRGLLFAKEFKRNIEIPMMYGVDYSDPGLRIFMNEYIKEGGSKNIDCYVNYFQNDNNAQIEMISVQELIKTIYNNETQKYTNEERNKHQELIYMLSQIQAEHSKQKKLIIKK